MPFPLHSVYFMIFKANILKRILFFGGNKSNHLLCYLIGEMLKDCVKIYSTLQYNMEYLSDTFHHLEINSG